MKLWLVIYGEIDTPEKYYGLYDNEDAANKRKEIVTKHLNYSGTNSYCSLWVQEFVVNQDITMVDK